MTFLKDPDAKLPFTIDWSKWLAGEGDTIASVNWVTPSGIVQETSPAPTVTDGKATVWLSGGTAGQDYAVVCRVTTTGGRVDDRTMQVKVRDR